MWIARLLVQVSEAALFAFLFFWFRAIDPAMTDARVAQIFGLILLCAVPLAMTAGRWADRHDRPFAPLTLCAGGAALGLLAMAAAPGLEVALTGYVLFGLSASVFLSLHSAQTLRVLPRARHRGRDLGVFNLTNIDRWFLVQIEELVRLEEQVAREGVNSLDETFLRALKRKGFADARLATLAGVAESEIRKLRQQFNLHPVYKRVDTCAAEFATDTAYMYSTYEEECEANPSPDREKIMILGGGPNRIGQGIEFDYCCVHAALQGCSHCVLRRRVEIRPSDPQGAGPGG